MVFYLETDSQIIRQNNIIEVYLKVFINYKENNWARLFLIVEFAYNNIENISIDQIFFKLNYYYYPHVSYKKDTDLCFKSKSGNQLLKKLKKLIIIYKNNLYYTQKLQKQAYDKIVKAKSYAFNKKVWLNSK